MVYTLHVLLTGQRFFSVRDACFNLSLLRWLVLLSVLSKPAWIRPRILVWGLCCQVPALGPLPSLLACSEASEPTTSSSPAPAGSVTHFV